MKSYIYRGNSKSSIIQPIVFRLFLIIIIITFFAHGISSAAEVTLAWDANTEPDLTGYKIHYDTSPGSPYYGTEADQGTSPITVLIKDLDDQHNPEFTITGLDDNEDYYFALTAFDNENLESGYSNEASTADENRGSGGAGCFIGTSAKSFPGY